MSEDEQALAEAYTAGFPPGWRVRRGVIRSTDSAYVRWTASRGRKPCVWGLLALRCGLSSTLVGVRLDALRAEAWRQEWLGVVYTVSLALTRTAALVDRVT